MKTTLFICLFLFLCSFHTSGKNSVHWKPVDPAFDVLNQKLEDLYRADESPAEAAPILREMQRLVSEKGNKTRVARLHYWESWAYLKTNNILAGKLLEKALAETDSVGDGYDFARIRFSQGTLLINEGNYLEAYISYKRLETYFDEAGDYLLAGKCCINTAYILSGIQEYRRPLFYLHKAEEYFLKGGYMLQATKNKLNISNALFQQNKGKEAFGILRTLLYNPVTKTDSVFLVSVLVGLDCGSTTPADHFKYSTQAYRIARRIQNNTCLVYTSVNLGNYYSIHNPQPDSALYYYRQAYSYSSANPDAYSITPILFGLSKSFALLNRADSAYHYLNAYTLYKDSLTGTNKITEINRQEGLLAIEKYESELSQAMEREQWNRKITLVILLSVVFLSILICYVFWILRKKEKIKKQLKEVENRELNENLSSKNRELTSNTLIISEKNQTLKALLKEIETLNEEDVLPAFHANRLKKEIKNHLNDKDEWQYFKLHFESVHPDFFTVLKQKYPVLTENDLRLCAYIRIGMNTKEISQMLSVLPETVNMARYRMRKKLELVQDESLEDLLRGVGEM